MDKHRRVKMTERDRAELKKYWERYPDTKDHLTMTVDTVVICPSFDERRDATYQQNDEFSFRILLVKRGRWPEEGKWALPGGFVKKNETCADAACRELKEEAGLGLRIQMPIGLFDEPGRDIRGWIASQSYVKIMQPQEGESVKGGSDADEAKWFRVISPIAKNGKMILSFYDEDELVFSVVAHYEEGQFGTSRVTDVEENVLAFDHGKIIASALLKLLACDPLKLVPYFLPERFTLPQFMEVYQYLTMKEIPETEKPNFRRGLTQKKNPLLVATGEKEELPDGIGHPPAMLYRLNA